MVCAGVTLPGTVMGPSCWWPSLGPAATLGQGALLLQLLETRYQCQQLWAAKITGALWPPG